MSCDELQQLHSNCIMALTIAPSTISEAPASENKELDPALYAKYVRYRAKLQDRVEYLQLDGLQHETPRIANADLCMPALLKKWNGSKKQKQGPVIFHSTYRTSMNIAANKSMFFFNFDYLCTFDNLLFTVIFQLNQIYIC